MHDFLKQFDALIAEGRVLYRAEYFSHCEYFPFLFSVGGSFIGKGLSGDEFRSWYRWEHWTKTRRHPAEMEVELASSRANGEFSALRQLGLLVPAMTSGRASSWASFIPSPDVLRIFLLTPYERDEEWRKYENAQDVSLEGKDALLGLAFRELTPEAVEAFRRCYRVADELERKLEETPSGV